MDTTTDVLIVGAGPVGLTLAVDLGRRGVDCVLVERKAAPEFLPKMERCNARTMEIFRRLGIAPVVRAAGLDAAVPMDVFIVADLTRPPLLHLPYPSVAEATEAIARTDDLSSPAEAYQLISQYTLEPLLKSVVEDLPSVKLRYGTELEAFAQGQAGVTATVWHDDQQGTIRARYLVGCDGGASIVRKALGIALRGEGDILRLRQALYRCDTLYDRLPIGAGPGHGRHYHVADSQHSFLIMQDSTRHWTLHAQVAADAEMAGQFEKTVGTPVPYEMLYVGEWKQNLLLADRYGEGRVFLAGDAAHLVIPTGGLGMNTGVGDAIDLGWKLDAVLRGWGGPGLLASYEVERRQVGDRNVGASRYASTGRRAWRSLCGPGIEDRTDEGAAMRERLARVADVEQRKTNEMIGAELGYRYIGSPVIWEEPGGPAPSLRDYDPTPWTGVRLPHAWVRPGVAMQDLLGPGFTVIRFGSKATDAGPLIRALTDRGAPAAELHLADDRLRELYGRALVLVRPDLHIVWRGDALPDDVAELAAVATGHGSPHLTRAHAPA